MKFSWSNYLSSKPFSVLAPMEEVSDMAFRQLILSIKRPDIFFTEFTSLEGIFSKGHDKVVHRLKYQSNELPLIAQVWGKSLELYPEGIKYIISLGFSGIDINMGCPDKDVVKNEAGAALINDFEKVKNIVESMRKINDKFPLSIKTRLGFNEINIDWIKHLLELKVDALSIHLRTAKAKSSGDPHYELMKEIAKLRDEISPNTVLICNGDIKSIEQGNMLCLENGFNGFMIGREAVNNPFVFNGLKREDVTKEMRIELALKHTKTFEECWGDTKNFNILKKFYVRYITNFDNAAEIRMKLMETTNFKDVYDTLLNMLD